MRAHVDRFGFLARATNRSASKAELPSSKVEGTVATIRIYDVIDSWGGFWGLSATEFAEVLDELPPDVDEIQLHLNSPGGEIWEGLAILNMLRQHRARVVVTVDAIAASAASVIAMAGDEVIMSRNSEMMIHDAMNICGGNAEAMTRMAERLNRESDNLAAVYAEKAGGDADEWRAAMKAETWYSAEEAVEAGLADRVDEKVADEQAKNLFDLSAVFAYAGREKAPAPAACAASKHSPVSAGGPAAAGGTTKKGAAVSDTLLANLRKSLGLADDADEATVLAEHDKAMASLQDLNDKASNDNKQTVPTGHVVVPEARLRDLETSAAAGVAAAKKLHEQEREAFLNSVRTKFAPANRDAWAKEYDRDPEAAKAHFKDAPDIVALEPIGHDGDGPPAASVDGVRETPAYKNWSMS